MLMMIKLIGTKARLNQEQNKEKVIKYFRKNNKLFCLYEDDRANFFLSYFSFKTEAVII